MVFALLFMWAKWEMIRRLAEQRACKIKEGLESRLDVLPDPSLIKEKSSCPSDNHLLVTQHQYLSNLTLQPPSLFIFCQCAIFMASNFDF